MPDAELWKMLGEIRGEMSAHTEEHRRIEHAVEEMQLTMQQNLLLSSRVDMVERSAKASADTLLQYDRYKNRGIGLAIGGAGLAGGSIAAIIDKISSVFK